jgi:hypothetical protein
MRPMAPVLDVFIGRQGDAWRLYFSGLTGRVEGWSIFPVGRPDVADLDRFMWDLDSPFERKATADGGLEILAKGRSALALAVWLEDLVRVGSPER